MKNVKVLCVADHIDPLVYSERIKSRFGEVDLVLGAGDLPINYYEYIVSCLNKPLYFIFGNHNLKKYHEFKHTHYPPSFDDYYHRPSYGSIHIGGKVYFDRNNDLILVGLGGSHRYSRDPNQYTELGMLFRILRMVPRLLFNRVFYGRFCDIFLTHAPPRGIHDKEDSCHIGFTVFLWFLRWFTPRYMVHGHIHLYDLNDIRKTLYYKTEVYNAYDHIVLNVRAEK